MKKLPGRKPRRRTKGDAQRIHAEGLFAQEQALSAKGNPTEEGAVAEGFWRVARGLLSKLSARELKVLHSVLIREMEREEVATEFGVSRGTIRQIEARALKKLRRPSINLDLLRQYLSGANVGELEAQLHVDNLSIIFRAKK